MIDSKCQNLTVFRWFRRARLAFLFVFIFSLSSAYSQTEVDSSDTVNGLQNAQEEPVFTDNLAAAIEDDANSSVDSVNDVAQLAEEATNLNEQELESSTDSSEITQDEASADVELPEETDDVSLLTDSEVDERDSEGLEDESIEPEALEPSDTENVLDEEIADSQAPSAQVDQESQTAELEPQVQGVAEEFENNSENAERVINAEEDVSAAQDSDAPLSKDIEDLKRAALELNRDLLILEEELLFPASTQVVLFLSMDVGNFFKLDSVKVSINDKVVASHLYTNRQNHALIKGGIQRLYMGNLKNGEHEVTAIFTGLGPDNREYKRGATTIISKQDDLKMLELKIQDSAKNMQPDFKFKEWEL